MLKIQTMKPSLSAKIKKLIFFDFVVNQSKHYNVIVVVRSAATELFVLASTNMIGNLHGND